MASWVLSLATGDAGEVGVAVETPRGPVVESLMERGFAVHSINPKQLDRFRDRLSPAGAKDDRRDARVLASALRTDPHCLRRLEPTDPAIVELREWSRLSEELTRERVRLANRMRDQLWRYYPQFLDAVDDDVAAPWALDLWQSLPTPRAGQRVREVTLTRVLKQHRIRRIDTATLRARLRAPAIKLTPGAAEAAVTHVRLVAERLALVNRQLEHVRRELDGLVHQLAQAAPTHDPNASTEDEPSSTKPPDAAILLSLNSVPAPVRPSGSRSDHRHPRRSQPGGARGWTLRGRSTAIKLTNKRIAGVALAGSRSRASLPAGPQGLPARSAAAVIRRTGASRRTREAG